MASKADLRTWILEALGDLGGSGSVVEVCRQVWDNHKGDLDRSDDLFYTWQYDIRWEAQKLRDDGYLRSAEGRRGAPWELAEH